MIRKELFSSDALEYISAFDKAAIVSITDLDGKIIYVNSKFCTDSGYSEDELLGNDHRILNSGFHAPEFFEKMWTEISSGKTWIGEIKNKTKYGSFYWVHSTIIPILDKTRKPFQYLSVRFDITKHKELEILLKNKNIEVNSSISYARRIQHAVLPPLTAIKEAFSNSFVLYKPKDIVSGDFYFFQEDTDKIFIAAADCTGHGVPGALLSILCYEKLRQSLKTSNNTNEILSSVNKGIKKTLRQSSATNSSRDGMDIAFCSVNKKSKFVEFSGAKRPIWVIRKGESFIKELKGTNKAIGGFTENNQSFETHTLQLQLGDRFYIFSDGYADQFGGDHDKKIMITKFKDIILEIQKMSMDEQRKYLDTFFLNWQGNREQVDDILVIGVEL